MFIIANSPYPSLRATKWRGNPFIANKVSNQTTRSVQYFGFLVWNSSFFKANEEINIFLQFPWIATLPLVARNDAKSYYHKQNHTFIFNILFFISQSLKVFATIFLEQVRKKARNMSCTVPSE
jgi:hypothetical protein